MRTDLGRALLRLWLRKQWRTVSHSPTELFIKAKPTNLVPTSLPPQAGTEVLPTEGGAVRPRSITRDEVSHTRASGHGRGG